MWFKRASRYISVIGEMRAFFLSLLKSYVMNDYFFKKNIQLLFLL